MILLGLNAASTSAVIKGNVVKIKRTCQSEYGKGKTIVKFTKEELQAMMDALNEKA